MHAQQQEATAPKARQPWRPRFRLASLLWLMLCVAVGITGYQWGLEAGKREMWRNRNGVGKQYTAVYYVADLATVSKQPNSVVVDFDDLIEDIETGVFPRTWESAGGSASIAGFPTNLSLVVSHDKDGHEEVARFLAAKRKATPSDIDEHGNPLVQRASPVE